jgi:hypothetical protein
MTAVVIPIRPSVRLSQCCSAILNWYRPLRFFAGTHAAGETIYLCSACGKVG